ncbi:hypothetical protein M2459_000466 [Parabacteroides sp. PF5-5]|uniref:RagB/SusD family nutrient uptake outer membrane protein n=1 Tax=unclassified Parabacteroides TaxID=2649774 RepID=UPI002475D064|nr:MULTISPECIES: RagB/SusD family nutrient uptake outer membrane protein [unclassified Parabacteroides]MDH6314922.1 hypothetical protein [Parabacteroides sp. PF5-13]MDH6325932.1 hypothetical protein [Parabacteroides sp. PH5-41]MDH6333732.1 hypothetical protein [Parabacteroides sp. PF5-5]MDH6344797.1 hypothetical protein [Parabacteroides sp. PH5-46]MDH6359933.1 hypothetical protein [Parabacteroides sp. PH5-16]
MKRIIALLTSIILFTNCSGFLDEENKAGITNEDLYSTVEGYETLRINAYSNLRLLYEEKPYLFLAGTDLYQMPRNVYDHGIYTYEHLYKNDGDVKTFYKNAYTIIQAVNAAEYYLDIAPLTDANRSLYKAEYDFIKGFVHFLLVEQFGGIVINDEFTQSPRIEIPRSSLEESYKYVIEKFQSALSGGIPQTSKDGSICKDIVNHYLAKAHLTRGWDLNNASDFAEAKKYAAQVINTRGNLKYTMEELWSPDNENNDEVIFAIQYDANSIATNEKGNDQESLFGPYLGGSERGHKYMTTQLYPSWAAHSWFGKNDARYEATFMLTIWEHYYDYYQGKADPAVNSVTAIYPRVWDKDKAEEMFNDYKALTGDDTAKGVFQEVSLTDEGKLREGVAEFVSKWCPGFEDVIIKNAQSSTGVNYLRVYPFIESKATQVANETYWRSGYISDYCQPVIKKFDLGKLVTFHQRQSYRDVVLATLSETMFLYAEACIAEGNYNEAETYINKVLARPGNAKDGGTLSISLPTSKEAALETYLKETGKELLGQYCGRWPELRRTQMLKTMYYKYNYDYLTVLSKSNADPIGQKLYRPIPQDAIDLNDALTEADQNPGY